MKDVQCYELFGGIALKNHAFSFFDTLKQFYAVYGKPSTPINEIIYESAKQNAIMGNKFFILKSSQPILVKILATMGPNLHIKNRVLVENQSIKVYSAFKQTIIIIFIHL